jgi:DNA polymerase III delta prime subunit
MTPDNDKPEIIPDMSAREMYENYFNLDFLSENEKITIFAATELYAKGKVRVAMNETPSKLQEEDKLREAASELLHLHLCEQEGLSSGQPTREQWFTAVDKLSAALTSYGKGSDNTPNNIDY